MNKLFLIIPFLFFIVTSCINSSNEAPEIMIENITKNGNPINIDDIKVNKDDTLKIYLRLIASKKDINSFTTKFKDLSNYKLEITEFDEATTYIEGNPVATSDDEDCTILFKDGTYNAYATISAIIKDTDKEETQLYLYLFSEEEAAVGNLDIELSQE